MKRTGAVFEQLVSFENLLKAFQKAKKGTNKTEEVLHFSFHCENKLLELRELLISGDYQPAAYRYFKIKDPKQRTIAVAPFVDRVVHHAIVNILEPMYELFFIHDSYATRKEKGTHAAVFRAQSFLRKNQWFLKADIQKFFDSIDHNIMIQLLERKLKDYRSLALIEKVIRNGGQHGKGLPIGNLTSQFFANVYLNGFDHFVKQQLKCRYYIRYMDDFVIFSDDKYHIKLIRQQVSHYMSEKLELTLKPSATFINQRINGLRFLGTRVFPETIRLHPDNAKRAFRKIQEREQAYKVGIITSDTFLNSMNSYCAYFTAFPFYGLRKAAFRL